MYIARISRTLSPYTPYGFARGGNIMLSTADLPADMQARPDRPCQCPRCTPVQTEEPATAS